VASFEFSTNQRDISTNALHHACSFPADERFESEWRLRNKELPSTDLPWYLASVNPRVAGTIADWHGLASCRAPLRILTATDFPLRLAVPFPESVGIDRIAGSTAAWHRWQHETDGILVVDAGTAITIDAVLPDGTFLGGAILPGPGLGFRALHTMTKQLPLIALGDNPSGIPAIGTDTETAIRSGVVWGSIGAVRELITRCEREARVRCRVVITGGAGQWMSPYLLPQLGYERNLVLQGVALAAMALCHTPR
jgi:type III pantothenate kinase